jgi:hypothetical protein
MKNKHPSHILPIMPSLARPVPRSPVPYRTYRTVRTYGTLRPYRIYCTVPYRTVQHSTVRYRTVPAPYRTVRYRTEPSTFPGILIISVI